MKVYLYQDLGVSEIFFNYTYKSFEETLPQGFSLEAVNHRFFLKNDWEKEAALIVFPGGRDTPYHEKLKGEANGRIKSYVENGGAFFGICAGGYYGSSSFEFEKGHSLEILAERELKFFPGKAIGPAYGKGVFQYETEVGYRLAEIDWEGGVCPVYFNGGCLFETPSLYGDTEIIAKYRDLPGEPAAIIHCKVGRGKALLSGVHPEYPFTLTERENRRKSLFKFLISLIIS